MKTRNYFQLIQHTLGCLSLVAAGTVVGLPAFAQVESPSTSEPAIEAQMPDATDTLTPDAVPSDASDLTEPSVDTLEETLPPDLVEETEETGEMTGATEEAPEETTEVTEDTPETTGTPGAISNSTEDPSMGTPEVVPTEEVTPAEGEVAPLEETTPADETESPTSDLPSEDAPDIAVTTGTIVDVAAGSETFKTLVSALTEAELATVLAGEGPFTVFAPTDEAFAALPEGVLDQLMQPENRDLLVKVLTYHVVPGAVMSADLTSGEVATVEGSPVTVAVEEDAVTVNGANVIQTDIAATNGVIHAIDQVIIPPDLQ